MTVCTRSLLREKSSMRASFFSAFSAALSEASWVISAMAVPMSGSTKKLESDTLPARVSWPLSVISTELSTSLITKYSGSVTVGISRSLSCM